VLYQKTALSPLTYLIYVRNVWLVKNLLVASSTSLDIKKETDKNYVIKTTAEFLPDGENVIYSQYYSLINND